MAYVTVRLRYLRIATRKVRLVTDLIRGARAQAALEQLVILPKRAAGPVSKLLKSGLAAAKERGLEPDGLRIERLTADQGPALKRRLINARGRASQVKKFMTHVTLTLTDTGQVKKKGKSRKNKE